jgi:hypothetical protein
MITTVRRIIEQPSDPHSALLEKTRNSWKYSQNSKICQRFHGDLLELSRKSTTDSGKDTDYRERWL